MRNKHEMLKDFEDTCINLTLTNLSVIETDTDKSKRKYPKTPPANVSNSKQSTPMRWCVLALLCIVVYSFVYCYDNPFAIQNQLIEDYGLSQMQYNLLYSVYGYINMIAPFFAGLMIDCMGINSSTFIFYVFIVIGQSLFVIACFPSIASFPLKLVGRAIFGMGGEQFHLSRKWLLYQWFSGTEYYFASGLSLSFSRLGSASQSYISTIMYDKHDSVVAVVSVGWVLVLLSFVLLLTFLYFQKKYSLKPQTESAQLNYAKTAESGDTIFQLMELCKTGFDRRWFLLGFVLVFFYSSYLAFSNVGSAFLQNRYKLSYDLGNKISPIMFWIAAIFTPIFGILCDVYGKRTLCMVSAGVSLLSGHILLGFIGTAHGSIVIPVFGLIFLGMGYSLGAAAVWPSFGLIVKQKYLATTLGIWSCVDNAFQATAFVIVGKLTKEYSAEERSLYNDEYDCCRYLWIGLSLGTLLWAALLWYYDRNMFDNVLWKPSNKFDRNAETYESVSIPNANQEQTNDANAT